MNATAIIATMQRTVKRHGWEWAVAELEAAAQWVEGSERTQLLSEALRIARSHEASAPTPERKHIDVRTAAEATVMVGSRESVQVGDPAPGSLDARAYRRNVGAEGKKACRRVKTPSPAQDSFGF